MHNIILLNVQIQLKMKMENFTIHVLLDKSFLINSTKKSTRVHSIIVPFMRNDSKKKRGIVVSSDLIIIFFYALPQMNISLAQPDNDFFSLIYFYHYAISLH